MLAIQIRAHAMLVIALMLVDAAAFHGTYQHKVAGIIVHGLSAVSPAHWGGSGRDWSHPGRPRT